MQELLSIGRRLALSLLLVVCVALPGRAADLTVFAAASLRDALTEIAEAWQIETGGTLTLSFAGSSALARQVQAGAPADLVILANAAWMDALQADGAIRAEARVDLLTNRLVVIGGWHQDGALDLTDPQALRGRLGRGRLALALVEAVPAGIYAKAALETLGLWESIEDRVVQADNVRGALAMVAARAASLGIVYATDARAERRIAVLAEIPAEAHPPILYPAAPTTSADSTAQALMGFLQSPIARAIFTGHGFGLVTEP